MLDWMNPISFLQTIIKVSVVWIAFYGAGHLVEKLLKIKKLFPLLPKEVSGILLLIVIEILLSLLGVMNRTVTSIFLLLFAIPGIFLLFGKLKYIDRTRRLTLFELLVSSSLLIVVVLNLTYASTPNLGFDDPLITYAVQPDRWLNTGRIHWIEETVFSAFPLTYEMIAVWPASLAYDRLNQISVLQVFQMVMLFIAIFRGMQIIEIRKKLRIPLAITILLCSLLFYWCSLAKTDTTAIFFSTIALTAAIREISDRSFKPYTSWFAMGLALATKQTSYVVLIPFMLYAGFRIYKSKSTVKLVAITSLILIPGAFGLRTMIKTGSPTYPVHPFSFLLKDQWKLLPPPEELQELNNRDSALHAESDYNLLKNIGIFLISFEGIIFIMIGGFVVAIVDKNRSWLFFVPILLYFAAAIYVFWPPWWGVKYTILIFPFVALLGTKLLQSRKNFSLIYLMSVGFLSFIIPGYFIDYSKVYSINLKLSVTKPVLTGNWDTSAGYKFNIESPEGLTQMWLNSYLTENSRILSLHEEKRYFCDHQIFVGWRFPETQPLYLDNTLEEECTILNNMGIDYVTFYRQDPCIMKMENRLEILDHIGRNDILEPIITVASDYFVCRYNPPTVHSSTGQKRNANRQSLYHE